MVKKCNTYILQRTEVCFNFFFFFEKEDENFKEAKKSLLRVGNLILSYNNRDNSKSINEIKTI